MKAKSIEFQSPGTAQQNPNRESERQKYRGTLAEIWKERDASFCRGCERSRRQAFDSRTSEGGSQGDWHDPVCRETGASAIDGRGPRCGRCAGSTSCSARVRRARPDVVVHEMTAIPKVLDLRSFDREFALTNRL